MVALAKTAVLDDVGAYDAMASVWLSRRLLCKTPGLAVADKTSARRDAVLHGGIDFALVWWYLRRCWVCLQGVRDSEYRLYCLVLSSKLLLVA